MLLQVFNVVDLKVQDDLTVTDDLIVNGDIDLEGSIDVNGTANLDVVDIDGAVDMASTDGAIRYYGETHSTTANRRSMVFTTGNAEAMRLASDQDVLIGTDSAASEAKLHVEVATSNPNAGSPTDSSAVMINGGTTTEGNGPVLALRNISGSKETIARLTAETTSGNNGDLTISVYAGGSTVDEKIRVQSGGGISFNGDTATANALDDYEEGSWTPALNNAGSPLILTLCLVDSRHRP
jgi:hypothetical protein